MSSSHEAARAAFQGSIDSLHDGETLELSPRELPGPIRIKHPVIIDGHGATIWALKGPVVTIEADGVVLRDLRIEVTGEDEAAASVEEESAILVHPGKGVLLEKVQVRGSVVGLEEEEGDWNYPFSLHLGRLAHGSDHSFRLRLYVPVPCRLKSHISGFEVSPHTLKAGPNEISLHIERLPQDTLLSGAVTLTTAFLTRQFTVVAQVAPASAGHGIPVVGANQVVWQPANWDALAAGPPPQPKPPEPLSVKPPDPTPSVVTPPPPKYPEPTPAPQPPAPQPQNQPAPQQTQPAPQQNQPAPQPVNQPAPAPPPPAPTPVPPVQPAPPVTPPPAPSNPTPSASRYRPQKTSLGTAFGSPSQPEQPAEEPEAAAGVEGSAPDAEPGGPALPPIFTDQGSGSQPAETPAPPPEAKPPVSPPIRTSSPRVRSVTLGSVFGEQTPSEQPARPNEPAAPSEPAPAEPEPKKKKSVLQSNLSALFTENAPHEKEE